MLDERNCPKYLINCKRLKDTMFTHLKRIMCFVLFLAIFTGIGIYSVEAKIAPDSITEEENIKSVIDAYFTSRYEARMEKTSDDFSSLVDETDPRSKAWLQREKDRQEVENVIADTFRTSYLSYEFTLDYEKIEVSGKDAVVDVRESNKVVYIDSPQNPSQIANLKHRITLKKVGDNWKVIDDLYEDETIKALKGMSKEEILDNIKMNYESIVHWPDQIESRSLAEAIPLADPAYDGSKALNYTYNWWNGINPTYHDAGNDCTNFASQAIYEGTNHTMDTSSDYYTDWYYDFPSHSGSLPWVQVGPFYLYLQNNPYPGKGPYGYAVANVCSLGGGDIIAMQNGGGWAHTVIVRVGGACPSSTNIRVDAHDTDSYNRLLSDYSSFTWYGVNITNYRP